jgi:hypothetical protein
LTQYALFFELKNKIKALAQKYFFKEEEEESMKFKASHLDSNPGLQLCSASENFNERRAQVHLRFKRRKMHFQRFFGHFCRFLSDEQIFHHRDGLAGRPD